MADSIELFAIRNICGNWFKKKERNGNIGGWDSYEEAFVPLLKNAKVYSKASSAKSMITQLINIYNINSNSLQLVVFKANIKCVLIKQDKEWISKKEIE